MIGGATKVDGVLVQQSERGIPRGAAAQRQLDVAAAQLGPRLPTMRS